MNHRGWTIFGLVVKNILQLLKTRTTLRLAQKKTHHLLFSFGKLALFVLVTQNLVLCIQVKFAKTIDGALFLTFSLEKGMKVPAKLIGRHRFCQVTIGTLLEASNLFLSARLAREYTNHGFR